MNDDSLHELAVLFGWLLLVAVVGLGVIVAARLLMVWLITT